MEQGISMITEIDTLAREMLLFHLERDIKYLYKSQLEILDLLSKEYGMTEASKANFRKLILDRGNEVVRGVQNEIAKYNVSFAGI